MRQTLPNPGPRWAVRLRIGAHSDGELLSLSASGRSFASVRADGGALSVRITAAISDNPIFPGKDALDFVLEAAPVPAEASLEWLGYSVRLYAGGELLDEEWPLGALPEGDWTMDCADGVRCTLSAPDEAAAGREGAFTGPMQYFTWPGSNTGVGDCMPFSRDGRYCLYYLFDRRGHRSKGGLGAHQWAQISSADLRTWTLHPMALPITEQWEGSICTGSLIQKDGLTYAFYAVRMSDGSPARMTWATSGDGVRFEKSGRYFALTDPYEPVSARDPMVFLGADGQYHMLVTTSLPALGRYGGALAHLVSRDLAEWTQLDPFIVPGYADQPECSDYFEWNGWYYLVFANFAVARYRMSRSPFGPWIKPAHDVLDTVEDQVVKTAAFGNRRLMTGFLARYPRTYAGNAVTHELVQRPDGTLGVRFVEEILPPFGPRLDVAELRVECAEGRAHAALAADLRGFRLRARLALGGDGALGGLSMAIGGREHRLDFDRAAGMISAMRPDHNFRMGDPRLQLPGVNLAEPIAIDLIVKGSILDLALGDGRAMTMRLSDDLSGGFELSAYAQTGALTVADIVLEPLAG
ncbi:MAG: glycosyl hydrolase [Clostridiales bacterium]|nr:glycosyl hydrolase [Clostridiales bacterium]